mmetsp:Transcript_13216/g.27163  ORF Transcript_13216/g.27163 Transcript_13216/m.27163 type:complete len:353 (-) Transcript_13216:611-1669(-)
MWSLGTIAYCLVSGGTLFDVDRDDNIRTLSWMGQLYRWNDDDKKSKLEKIEDSFTKAFLSKLLSKQPRERGSVTTALEDAFFDDKKRADEAETSKANERLRKLERGQKDIQNSISEGQESMTKVILRAMLSVSTAHVPTLWILSKGVKKGMKRMSAYEMYELRMLCQITGQCKHTPIKLHIMKASASKVLTKAAPLIKFTLLLLKVGAAAGKLYGIPIPTELPFLEDVDPKDVGEYLDEWIQHFECLEESQTRGDFEDPTEEMSKLCLWKERNDNSGLETCQQLKTLLDAFGENRPYDDEKIAMLSGLEKMVSVYDGSCIWVDTDCADAMKRAKEYGYMIKASLNRTRAASF